MAEQPNNTKPQTAPEENPKQEETNAEVKPATAALMIIVALLFDGIQAVINLIPIVGQILSFLLSIFAFLTFYVWFKMNGISFAKPKRAGKLIGGGLIELIPILNVLPAWTLAVFLIISETKINKLAGQIPGGDKITSAISNNKQQT